MKTISNATWWPSPYGADDQIGMLNEITPEKIIAAARLVKIGDRFYNGFQTSEIVEEWGTNKLGIESVP